MKILAIETSCDDTGVALVEVDGVCIKTLSSALSSQDEVHSKWGGIYPTEAKREHQQNLFPAFLKVVSEGGVVAVSNNFFSAEKEKEIETILSREPLLFENLSSFFDKKTLQGVDAVAVTTGPGLEPCLYVGVNFARAVATYLSIPLIPVNHIKAHVLFFLKSGQKVTFPALAMVISGGHTELVLMNSPSSFKLIGRTRDDAAGECLDKVARILGLGYPGGPAISREAEKAEDCSSFNISLPRPMQHSSDFDFSFSGLKTAVLYDYKKRDDAIKNDPQYIACMAREAELAVVETILYKIKKAAKSYGIKSVVVGGGVTANKVLRKKAEEMAQKEGLDIFFPPAGMSTDNAEMIAVAATVERATKNIEDVVPNANLKMYDIISEK